MASMIPTKLQAEVQSRVARGESLLVIAPTGLGKTFAATGDLATASQKTIYAVPLRALGFSILEEVQNTVQSHRSLKSAIHYGNLQESRLFGEEFVVTTYDQVVCGVPGLPLSFSLKAGHAIAGALLMSRLILDEAHLAWGISEKALAILLGILDFRRRFGLQTVVMTATLPQAVGEQIASALGIEVLIAGEGILAEDEALQRRNTDRRAAIAIKALTDRRRKPIEVVAEILQSGQSKQIYFANTVERLQQVYDALVDAGVDEERVIVLHNRMPGSWREKAEKLVRSRFGKDSAEHASWILLTNQVAEAGLDISAPAVFSDPAPVDTLVQRAGRCARWFRQGVTTGTFTVFQVAEAEKWWLPYRDTLVKAALQHVPVGEMNWDTERRWVEAAWGGDPKKAQQATEEALGDRDFALNLFDRAAQERSPGQIARVFREVVNVEAVIANPAGKPLLRYLKERWETCLPDKYPETSSISLAAAYRLSQQVGGAAAILTYETGKYEFQRPDTIRPGDVVVFAVSVAYLHPKKGLCFGATKDKVLQKESEWLSAYSVPTVSFGVGAGYQSLFCHTREVIEKTQERLAQNGAYKNALRKVLTALEPNQDIEVLAGIIVQIASLGAAFHDIGKAHVVWQTRARDLNPSVPADLIGRTGRGGSIGIAHTPPAFLATEKACELLLGLDRLSGSSRQLVRVVALAAARHHSSLLNPASVIGYSFEPHSDTDAFCREILSSLGVPDELLHVCSVIVEAASHTPALEDVPLMLPNDDLFPLYALVGRAILMADRESAASKVLETWRA